MGWLLIEGGIHLCQGSGGAHPGNPKVNLPDLARKVVEAHPLRRPRWHYVPVVCEPPARLHAPQPHYQQIAIDRELHPGNLLCRVPLCAESTVLAMTKCPPQREAVRESAWHVATGKDSSFMATLELTKD